MNFENTVQFALKGAKEHKPERVFMDATKLFKVGDVCDDTRLAVAEILASPVLKPGEKTDAIFAINPRHEIPFPALASQKDSAIIERVVGVALETLSQDAAAVLLGLLRLSKIAASPDKFRDGCIFGILSVVDSVQFTGDTGPFSYRSGVAQGRSIEFEECTGAERAWLYILVFLFEMSRGAALSTERSGQLANCLGRYVRKEETVTSLRMRERRKCLSTFLLQALTLYEGSEGSFSGFPSSYTENFLNAALFHGLKLLTLEEALETVGLALDPGPE
jgi:hypothetical protein